MSGRKNDIIWNNFTKKTTVGKSGCRAVCNKCGKDLQGLVERLKKHVLECTANCVKGMYNLYSTNDGIDFDKD
jgi:hypothetical protein